MRRPSIALLAVCTVSACGGGEEAPTGVARIDSAGITIVTNTAEALAAAPRWSVDSVPALEIETPEDGAYTLYRVGAVVPLSGGRLAVANGGSSEVLVFGDDGNPVLRLGGEGDGPGEFRSVGSVVPLPGDSLAVYDSRNGRLSVFDGTGRVASSVTLLERIRAAHGSWGRILPLAGGDLVLFTGGDFNSDTVSRPAGFRARSESLRLGLDGSEKASYGMFDGSEVFAANGAAGLVTFGAMTEATTVGDDLVVGLGVDPELRTYAPSGALTRISRWPDHERTVTDARFQKFLDAGLAQTPEAQRTMVRDFMSRVPVAEREPPYQDIVASDDGHLWVGDYPGMEVRLPGVRPPLRHWLVFAPDGSLAAKLDSPEGFELKAVQGSRLIGVYKDELDVESVRAYRVGGM